MTVRRMANRTNRPTPRAMATRRPDLLMEGITDVTWLASTCTSGSAMVTANPIKNPASSIGPRRRI